MATRARLFLGSGLIAIGAVADAAAQTTPPVAIAQTLPTDEIVVTAQRRAQSVQKVGAGITALSAAQVTNFRVKQTSDIAPLTSGLSTLNFASDATPVFAIRGVGLDDFSPNNSSGTALYIDGIYQTGPVFQTAQLFDVGRVEVLKGPQGTLYGKNATGGAISIVSHEPTDHLDGYATVGAGRWGTVDLNGAVGGRLGGGFSARIAGTMTYQDHGFQRDIDTGKRYGRTETYAGRALLKYAGGDFTAILNVHASQDSSTPSSYQADMSVIPGLPNAGPLFDTGSTRSDRVRVGGLDLKRDVAQVGTSLTNTLDFDFATATLILGFDHVHYYNTDNNDGVPEPVVDLVQNEHVEQYYEEFRLASRQPLFGRVNWIIGNSYSYQHFRADETADFSTAFVGLFLTPPDLSTPGLSVALARYLQEPSSLGFFFHTTTDITPRFRAIVGGRYSSEKTKVNGASTEVGSANGGILFHGVGSVVAALNDEQRSDSFDYKLGLEYDLAPRILAYATTSTGTKSGLYHLGPVTDPASWLYTLPEKVTAYEAGFKASLLDRRLVINPSAFYYDYTDRQTAVPFISAVTTNFATALVNIPKSRVVGFEVDTTVRPVNVFTIATTLAYLNTKVTRTIDNIAGQPFLSPILVGSRLAQSPELSFSVQGTLDYPLTDKLNGFAQLTYYRSSSQLTSIADPLASYGPNSSLDGRVALRTHKGFEAALWGKNLANNNDITSATSYFFGRTIYRRKPISYGIELTRRF